MSPATIGISLLLVAAGLSLTGRKAAIIRGYVIGFALLALFLTIGAGCVAIDGFRSWAGRQSSKGAEPAES
jgi:hypothetical protein